MAKASYLIVILTSLLVDQGTKLAVERGLEFYSSRRLVGELVKIKPVYNSGGAFGVFPGKGTFFTIFSLVAIALLLSGLFVFDFKFFPSGLGLSLIAGGAVGNLVDRLRNGAVTDFIQIGDLPIFNVADTLIVIGAGLVIFGIIKEEGYI